MSEELKSCVFCRLDCSGVPHMRDKQGRYACTACVEAERQRRTAANSGSSAPARELAGVGTNGASLHAADKAQSGYDLADGPEPAPADGTIPLTPAEPAPTGAETTCPVCIIRMPPDLGRCVQCGYDPKVGVQSSRKVRKTRTKEGAFRPICSQCGYDMTGVPGTRCPECGTVCELGRRAYDRSESRRIAMWSYLKPAIMFVVGFAGILGLLALTGEMSMLGFYITKWITFVPLGVAAFFVCCLLWLGFDAPFHRVALELAGIYAVVDLISLAVYCVVPFYLVNGLVVYFVYIALLASFLDLDYSDAVAVAFINLLLRIALLVTLAQFFDL